MRQNQFVRYTIRIRGQIDLNWLEWFEGFTISPIETGETILSGFVSDQAALHGLLNKLFAMNLVLVSVHRMESGSN